MNRQESVTHDQVIDRLRVVCDECVRVVTHTKLIHDGLESYIIIECHDGLTVLGIPNVLVRTAQPGAKDYTVLRSQLIPVSNEALDAWHQAVEAKITKLNEVLLGLEKVMGRR